MTRGVKPVSCNTYIKALNTFCLWAHTEGHVSERLELSRLKVEKRIIQILHPECPIALSRSALVRQKKILRHGVRLVPGVGLIFARPPALTVFNRRLRQMRQGCVGRFL